MKYAIDQIRMYLIELLLQVQLSLAPKSPDGDEFVRWVAAYAEATKWRLENERRRN